MDTTTHTLHVSFFGSVKAKKPTIETGGIEWPELVRRLSTWEIRPQKDGPLWSPAEYPHGTTRSARSVIRVSALVLDIDDGTPPDVLEGSWAEWEYVIHSTWSHSSARPHWRVVFPLAEPVSGEEWPGWYSAAARALGDGHADPTCKDASRIFYLPADDGADPAGRIFRHHGGRFLDPGFVVPEKPQAGRHGLPGEPGGIFARATPERIGQMLDKALRGEYDGGAPGRNVQGMHLACALRDNGVPQAEALHVLIHGYLPQVVESNSKGESDPYTEEEAVRAVEGAYSRPAREPWAEKATPIDTSDLTSPPRHPDDAPIVQLKTVGDFLEGAPDPEMLVPPGWSLAWSGTGKMVQVEGEHGEQKMRLKPVADAPVLLTGRAIDITTREQYLVASWPGPRRGWEHELVPREKLRHARGLQTLSARGFPYLELEGKQLVSYLAQVESANASRLPTARLTSKLGWQGAADDGSPFLLGHTLIRRDGEEDRASALDPREAATWTEDAIAWHTHSEGEDQLVRAYRRGGTWAGYLAAVGALRTHPVALSWWYLGFAPILLDVFGCPNFVTELAYPTSTGKTTLLRAVASIYGNPDERTEASLVQKWNQTAVYAERAAGVCNHLPLLLDDTSQARPGAIKEFTYSVSSGRGRGRGSLTGLAETAYWRTVMFSTGEHPLAADTQAGGVRTRTLSFQTAPFDAQDKETGRVARRLNDEFCRHFGHAAPRFLSWLLRNRAHWPAWRQTYQEWVEWYAETPGTPESGRLAQYAALGTLAGELVHAALQFPWAYENPIRELWPHLADHARDAAGAERALEQVISWARSHEREFVGRGDTLQLTGDGSPMTPPSVPIAGRWDRGDSAPLHLFPHVLNQILKTAGFVPEAILTEWRVKGIIDHDPGKFTSRIRISAERARVVTIRAKWLQDGEEGEE